MDSTRGGDGNAGAFAGVVSAPPHGYAMSGKIMLTAVVILFAVVLSVLFLHIYFRWCLLRCLARRRRQRGLVFSQSSAAGAPRGLDPEVLKSLPATEFAGEEGDDGIECAVCLSEIEKGEKVRILPKCRHGFHVECIDMWFGSHASCPLCRAAVEAPPSQPEEEAVEPSTPTEDASKSPRTAMVMLRRLWSSDSRRGSRAAPATDPEPDPERGEMVDTWQNQGG